MSQIQTINELASVDISEEEEALEHYGVMGMKWGRWNSETARKYHGGGLGRAANSVKRTMANAGDSVATGAKKVAKYAGKKISAKASQVAAERAAERQRKEDVAKQREELGMSRAKYDKIRKTTLRSHDPRVVEKGMFTLTDEELNAKINRLQREETISQMSTKLSTRKSEEAKKRNEAIAANPLVKLGSEVAKKKLDSVLSAPNNNGGNNSNKSASGDSLAKQIYNDAKEKLNNRKANKESDKRENNTSTSSSEREPKPYETSSISDGTRKAVRESAMRNETIDSDTVQSAATRGKRLLEDGTIRAEVLEVIDVTPVASSSERRKQLPPGRG